MNCHAQSVIVYPSPAPNFGKESDRFLVRVTQNGVTKNSFVYKSRAGNGLRQEWGEEQNNSFHFTTFSFSGSITIDVIKLQSSASSAIVRSNALSKHAIKTIDENKNKKITFQLNKPAKISIEFSDDPKLSDALMIFADRLEKPENVPSVAGTNVLTVKDSNSLNNISPNKTIVYFPPGVFIINQWVVPPSINQIYIAGGAYVKGYINKQFKNAIKINGRGILSNEGFAVHYPSTMGLNDSHSKNWYPSISIQNGLNNYIEGVTIIESTAFNISINANNTVIDNVNINGFRYNNDGITIGGADNRIENCFIRTNDDAIVIYSSHLTIDNCVFWQLQGSIIQLGWTPHSMDDITISNCEILHDKAQFSEGNVGFINAMNFSKSQNETLITNVTVNNIYFDTPILRFLDIRGDRKFKLGGKSPAMTSSLPWSYKNFRFTNIHFNQANSMRPLIFVSGYDQTHPLSNFTFENVYFKERKASTNAINDTSFIKKNNVVGLKVK
jgi:hypothetical protein